MHKERPENLTGASDVARTGDRRLPLLPAEWRALAGEA